MRREFISRIIVVAMFLWPTVGTVRSQDNRNERLSNVSEDTYERVLDILLPREVLKDPKLRFAFVLRYQPTFKPESQIVIVGKQSGVEVMIYRSVEGNIETRLYDIIRDGGKAIPEVLAKQIKVQKESVTLPEHTIDQFHNNFFEALALSEKPRLKPAGTTVNVTSDGTDYRLWYVGRSKIQGEFQGSGITNATRPDEPALIEWMKIVNKTVLHTKGQ